MPPRALALAFAFATAFAAGSAAAAPRWIDRPMTLPRLVFQGDGGIGVGHVGQGPGPSMTGPALNLEGAIGVTDKVELGLRTGVRMNTEARALQADGYARTLWTETWGTGVSTVANPEARVRWTFYSGNVAEIGLDGRLTLPFETGTRIGGMIGVPFAIHAGDILRIDTGAYLPVMFTRDTFFALTVPAYFWFQPNEKLFLGPMASLRFVDPITGVERHFVSDRR